MSYLDNSFYFYGISSLETNKALSFTSSMESDYTLNFAANSIDSIDKVELTYLFVGQSPATLCLKNAQCQQSSQLYILARECVKACPSSARPVQYVDGAIECVPCPSNMQYSEASKRCVCMPGFSIREKSCVQRASYARASEEEGISAED